MQKEGIGENYITKLNNLKAGFMYQHKKTIFKIEFQKFNLRLSIIAVNLIWKSAWNNPWL